MKSIISTELAPAAIGPYSQAVCYGAMVYTSGQLPLDPKTMSFPAGGIEKQTYQSLENLRHVLEHAGAGMDTVVKTTCFLADINDFPLFNQVYQTFFPGQAPARSCVEVANLPKGALIEVEATAFIR